MPLECLSTCLAFASSLRRYVASAPPVSSDRIARDVGFEAGRQSLAGALSSVGVNCTKAGRRMPFTLSYAAGATAGDDILPEEIAAMVPAAQ
jgi:hypothetical protein